MSLRIAFTGTGHISRIHAQAAQAQDDMELVAVVNHRPESRAEFAAKFGIRRQYDDVTNLLEDGDVDALVVSTPNYLHAPQSYRRAERRRSRHGGKAHVDERGGSAANASGEPSFRRQIDGGALLALR